jgi:hypothetical protein
VQATGGIISGIVSTSAGCTHTQVDGVQCARDVIRRVAVTILWRFRSSLIIGVVVRIHCGYVSRRKGRRERLADLTVAGRDWRHFIILTHCARKILPAAGWKLAAKARLREIASNWRCPRNVRCFIYFQFPQCSAVRLMICCRCQSPRQLWG